jgi:ATP-binding cassette subfamily B (MDR/TAP) protein 1
MFGISGENLTKRLRSQGFKTMLSQEVAWYDDPSNNVGTLCTRLAVEAAAIQGVSLFFI